MTQNLHRGGWQYWYTISVNNTKTDCCDSIVICHQTDESHPHAVPTYKFPQYLVIGSISKFSLPLLGVLTPTDNIPESRMSH